MESELNHTVIEFQITGVVGLGEVFVLVVGLGEVFVLVVGLGEVHAGVVGLGEVHAGVVGPGEVFLVHVLRVVFPDSSQEEMGENGDDNDLLVGVVPAEVYHLEGVVSAEVHHLDFHH